MSVYTENTVIYALTTTLSNAYVLSNTACVLSTIQAVNTNSITQAFTVNYNYNGQTVPIVNNISLMPYSAVNCITGKYMMKQGGYMTAVASANNSIQISFSGMERTN